MFSVFKKCSSSTYDFVMASAATVNELGSYAHNPRGNLWFNDESSYGQRMLLKMGWNKGKGLGKKEDGITENLKVKFKSTNAGLGYKDDPCANIMKTEYESILKELRTEYSQQKAESSSNRDKREHKNKVCKQKSKAIKRKIRYPKLFYGKDVSKYSEKDMKGIFICSLPSIETEKEKVEADDPESCQMTESVKDSRESNTYSSQLSISDYFDLKKKEKKDNESKKSLSFEIKSENTDSQCSELESADLMPSEKKCKEKKKKSRLHVNKDHDDPIILGTKDKEGVPVLNEKQRILPQNVASDNIANKKTKEEAECNENNQPSTLSKKRKKSHVKEESCYSNRDVLSSFHNDVQIIHEHKPCKKRKKSHRNVSGEVADSVDLITISLLDDISEKCKEINNVSTFGSGVEILSKSKPENQEEVQIISTGSIDSFNSNKHTKSKEKLKNKQRKLKSCLKSKKNKYTVKSEKNVSFNENISYKTIDPYQEPSKYNPKCAHIRKMLDDIYDGDFDDDEFAVEVLLMDCVCGESEEKSEPTMNFGCSTMLNVPDCSISKQTKTPNVPDRSKSKQIKTPNVPDSSKSKQIKTPNVPDSSTSKQIKSKRPKECTVSIEEPAEVCNSPTDLPSSNSSHYNSWIASQKLALKMKMYKNMLKCFKTHDVFKTTNLSSMTGYGNWGFN